MQCIEIFCLRIRIVYLWTTIYFIKYYCNFRCEGLADIIWQNRQQIRQVESLCSQVHLNVPGDTMAKVPMLNSQITSLLSSLVTR